MFQIKNFTPERIGLGHLRFEFWSLFRIGPAGRYARYSSFGFSMPLLFILVELKGRFTQAHIILGVDRVPDAQPL
jgi:hypothetical protein